MKISGALGIVILGIGFYIYSMHAQTRDVEQFCAMYLVGSPAGAIFETAERYSGKLMGGNTFLDGDKPQSFIYCAPMTMCDVSCSLEVKDRVITKSEFVSL